MEIVKNKRNYFFDNLKFVLILLVVLGHLIEPLRESSHSMRSAYLMIYSFHMPLFVFLFGYFCKSIDKNNQFNLKKPIGLLLLFFLMRIMVVLFSYITTGNIEKFDFFNAGGIYWYLLATSMYCFTVPIIKDFKLKVLLPITIIISCLSGFDPNINSMFSMARIINFYPFFVLGYFTQEKQLKQVIKLKYKYPSLLLLLLFAALVMYLEPNIYEIKNLLLAKNPYKDIFINGNMLVTMIYRVLWFLGATFLSILVMNIIPKTRNKLTKYGANTLQIYFFHLIIIKCIYQLNIIKYILQCGIVYPLILLVIAFITVIVLGQDILKKPFDKILNLNLDWLYKKEQNNPV